MASRSVAHAPAAGSLRRRRPSAVLPCDGHPLTASSGAAGVQARGTYTAVVGICYRAAGEFHARFAGAPTSDYHASTPATLQSMRIVRNTLAYIGLQHRLPRRKRNGASRQKATAMCSRRQCASSIAADMSVIYTGRPRHPHRGMVIPPSSRCQSQTRSHLPRVFIVTKPKNPSQYFHRGHPFLLPNKYLKSLTHP